MLGLETLDVAIGLIFVYLLLSLICSAISELIEAALKKRATNLAEGIRVLLNDTTGEGLAKQVYEHPLVFGLFSGAYTPKGRNLPTYIPARNFALALMDTVLKAGPETPSGAAGATAARASSLEAANQFQLLRGAVASIQNVKLRDGLLTLVDAAGNDVSRARENIEGWFNSSMDEISGWYKRRAQVILLFLGLAVTVIANADTVAIVTSLTQDQALRASLVAASQQYVQRPPDAPGDAQQQIKENMERIQKLGLPVGWDATDPRKVPHGAGWVLKVLGWLLTAMAVSLGAPFWFDLLNKFMVIRATVKPREKSQEEGSEDRQMPKAGSPAPAAGGDAGVAGGEAGAALAVLEAAQDSTSFVPNEWAEGEPQEGVI